MSFLLNKYLFQENKGWYLYGGAGFGYQFNNDLTSGVVAVPQNLPKYSMGIFSVCFLFLRHMTRRPLPIYLERSAARGISTGVIPIGGFTGNLIAGTGYNINELINVELEAGYQFGSAKINNYSKDNIGLEALFVRLGAGIRF